MLTSAVLGADVESLRPPCHAGASAYARNTVTVTENVPVLSSRLLRWEIVVVFAVSLGASGVYALVSFIGSLTAPQSLGQQTAVLNGALSPRPLLDLFLQLTNITLSLAPVALVFYLLARGDEGPWTIGLDRTQPGRDLLKGAILAALIGGSGLGLYLIAYHSGANLNVVAENLPDVWWRIPVLILSAAQNATLEEVIVVGYLLTRLDKLGFIGNATMGVIFAYLYKRWGRVTPLIIAHTLIDSVAFVGYALLVGHVSWLPKP
jgi:membrane protease YdiL (CAAX protease family)